MKKIKTLLLTAITILSACKEDFIDLAPVSEPNAENFYKTANDFNTALVAAYSTLQSHVDIYFELVEYRSDNLFLDAPTAGTQDRYNIDKFKETSANELLNEAWGVHYNGLLRCNKILTLIGGVEMNEALKEQYEGEARFIRAYTYFNLVRFWGKVPLVLQPVSPEEALKIGRTDVSKVYNAIKEDLTIASEYLPSSYSGSDLGRATSGAASTLLGKVYLTQGKFSEAKAILSQVLGKYSLLNNVDDVFDVNNKMNTEIIFAIRFNKDVVGEGHGLWFSVSDITTSPISDDLLNAFSANDKRRNLVAYTKVGSVLVLNKFHDERSLVTNSAGNDYIILRYPDVLLMYAEAHNEMGYNANGDAFKYLNEVHTRAGLTPLTSDDLPNQVAFRAAILKERQFEFPFEGQRWFDLIRTGAAIDEIAKTGLSIREYQFIYPVPNAEIEKINNKDIFDQNPGYN